jgi:hypothetical protein
MQKDAGQRLDYYKSSRLTSHVYEKIRKLTFFVGFVFTKTRIFDAKNSITLIDPACDHSK